MSNIFSVETKFKTSENEIDYLEKDFGHFIDNHFCVLSTPILTNAGRYRNRPLSACTVPEIDLNDNNEELESVINVFHEMGMGTGFSFDSLDNPIEKIISLNEIALRGAKSGRENRPVGNMGILSVYHPKIEDFIKLKITADRQNIKWKFNLSVDIDENFITSINNKSTYKLMNGKLKDANEIFDLIVESAHKCGDPGLVYLDRLNRDNPVPAVGKYISTAPCAEVGLSPGEACQFGYINIARFLKDDNNYDFEALQRLTHLLVRVLDNALELSLPNYPYLKTVEVMTAKRKIGIGICGVADLLIKKRLPYDSMQAREYISDILCFINFHSKKASYYLGKTRGSFGAMNLIIGNEHLETPSFIERKYGSFSSKIISKSDWNSLAAKIREEKCLRNATTIALPPTGRSGLVINASTGVEPLFSLVDYYGNINKSLRQDLIAEGVWNNETIQNIKESGSIQNIDEISENIKRIYKTALEIEPIDHLKMVERLQNFVDESISKTINLPEDISIEDTKEIYLKSYKLNLKGITIYRKNSRRKQPRKLSNNSK
ncbi:hypothetical protein [uncultured Croceitalea sp.]|uniref:hypothetical protein n=1 Tax=uncultured Croceitalea sp. TaxID=1798908 RepID=UPI00374E8CE8